MLFEYTMYAGDGYVSKCGTEQPIERGSAEIGFPMQNAFFRQYTHVDTRFSQIKYCYVRENYGET